MEKSIKLLGICILLSALIVSISLVFVSILNNQSNRYKSADSPMLYDSKTGTLYYMNRADTPGMKQIIELPK